jgi:hypothetical protein
MIDNRNTFQRYLSMNKTFELNIVQRFGLFGMFLLALPFGLIRDYRQSLAKLSHSQQITQATNLSEQEQTKPQCTSRLGHSDVEAGLQNETLKRNKTALASDARKGKEKMK